MIPCPQWSPIAGDAGHGRCARRRYGGKPELGMCRQCLASYPEGDAPEARPHRPEPPPPQPLRGLGDLLAALFAAAGLDRLFGPGCGCAARRATLNALVPLRRAATPPARSDS